MQAVMQFILDNNSLILNSFSLAHVILGTFLIATSQVISKQQLGIANIETGDIDGPARATQMVKIFKTVGISSIAFAGLLSLLSSVA